MKALPSKNASKSKSAQRWVKRGVWLLLIGAVVVGAVVAAMPKPVPVETARVDKGPLIVTVDEDGVTRVKDRYVVSTPLSGNLARIELSAGDTVKRGAVLARILPLSAPLLDARSRSQGEAQVARARAAAQQAKAQIERANAAKEYATKEAERTRELFRKNTISQAELDRVLLEQRARNAESTSAEFADKVAQHELAMARAALGRLGKDSAGEQFEIPSPIAGQVLKVMHQSEGVVQAGAPLLELGDPEALEIVVDVLTNDAVQIRSASAVTIVEWGGEPLSGSVRLVEPSAFTKVSALGVEEQRVNAVVDLSTPYTRWKLLGDGYQVQAKIQVYRTDSAVRVPAGALFRDRKSWAVFVIEAGVARLKPIEVARKNDQFAEVVRGVAVGDSVIVHPSDQVKDGTEVQPR